MPILRFFKHESASGVFLLLAALAALILDNSSLASWYDRLLESRMVVAIEDFQIAKPLLLWINDGLMAIFFLLVGLEIKREVREGELSSRERAMLPASAAIGGMVAPALVFMAFNAGEPTARGWAIPAATDIAFALGLLALLGKRVPVSLKIFLTALAIIDDLGAIVIIALFYTENLSLASLGVGLVFVVGLFAVNRAKVRSITPYALLGLGLWVCVLKSGVHATLAGVIVALAIPLKHGTSSPAKELEHSLHPWVAFLIMPVFAFANAGVPLAGITFDSFLEPLPLGIALGLFVGKQVGVVGFTALAIKVGWARRPLDLTWRHLYGAALLSGVGFTMSLFIGTLAFDSAENSKAIRIGVIGGSLLSGLSGLGVLLTCRKPAELPESPPADA